MKIHIDLDDKFEETSITIQAKEWSKELDDLISMIKQQKPQRLFGVKEEQTILLEPANIDYVFVENRKTYAVVQKEQIEVRMKLYEVEEVLVSRHFMRFSKSVIGNLQQIARFELSFNGNLCVYFHSGNKEYITRKYVNSIKEKLMIGGLTDDK